MVREKARVLASLFNDFQTGALAHDHLARDDELALLLLTRQLVHQVQHQVLDDHPQAASADATLQRHLGNRLERVIREAQLGVFVLEQLLILPRDCVARLGQNLDQRRLVELVQGADDGQAADKFGNQSEFDQILRLDLLENDAEVLALLRFDVGLETECLLADASLDGLVEADERARCGA